MQRGAECRESRPRLIREEEEERGATHWVSLSPQIKTTEPDVSVPATGETRQLSPTEITFHR